MSLKNRLLFLLVVLLNFSLYTQSNEKAFNKALTLTIEGNKISAYALIAAGNDKKETIILLHGLPGNEKNLDLAENIRHAGKNVIFFNDRGSWGSEGVYLYSNCLQDITKVIDYITKDDIATDLHVDKDNIVLIGHSLGGGIALLHGIKDRRVSKIIALSTFNAGEVLKNANTIKDVEYFMKYLDKQFMLNINSENFLTEIITNKREWNLKNNLSMKNKPILFIDKNNRNKDWIEHYKSKKYLVIDSDHSFSNKRIKLINDIINWLNIKQ